MRQGEPGRAFFVVLAGEAEAYLSGPDNSCLPLARFGPGATFGEMALLRGEPVSATVRALSAVRLLEFPATAFLSALRECEELHSALLATLSERLDRTSRDAWARYQREQALHSLLDSGEQSEALVAESAHMRKVAARIRELAPGRDPVLITGEAGAGKMYVARKLHEAAGGGLRVVVDCARLPREDADRILLGSAGPTRATDTVGSLGAVHLAGRGTLVLRHVESLPITAQRRVVDLLTSDRNDEGGPRPRIVATTTVDLSQAAVEGRFEPELAAAFAVATVAVPRLCDRKVDVLPLVRLFLAARGRAAGSDRLAQDAEHAFVSRRYRNRNVAELREAVELAADFAGGLEIRAEHIFAGPKSEAGPAELDIGALPLVTRLIRPGILAAMRLAVLASFAVVIALVITVPGRSAGRLANAAIWGVWEPVIILAFLLLGHVWCTVCPLSTAGRMAQRLVALRRPPPEWLKRASVWLATAWFFAIVWAERAFHMTRTPFASGLLLLALMGAAVVFGVLYQRETWCRYLCPLGTLSAGYALPATLQVRANPNVCATYCTDHACYKGSSGVPGCSVFHHPLFASEGHLCKLCFNCLHVCPHGSAKLYIRPPLQAVWRLGGLSEAMAPFSLSIFFLAPVMLMAQRWAWLGGVGALTVAMLAALVAGAVASRILPVLLGGDGSVSSRVAFTLLLLAWGPLMAYQLGNIGGLASVTIHTAAGTPLEGGLPPGGVTLQVALQLTVVVLALAMTLITMWRTRVWQERLKAPLAGSRWTGLRLGGAAYAALAVAIILA